MKILSDILYKAGTIDLAGFTRIEIHNITADSREVTQGSCFIAVKGTQTDGHNFIEAAVSKGARAVICESIPENRQKEVTYVAVKSSTKALGIIAANFFDQPSTKLNMVAITGTNGKTSVATMLYQLFEDMGYPSGLISTIDVRIHKQKIPATHTTPDAVQLQKYLANMVEAGVSYCFMEASSHGIEQERLVGTKLAGAVFTNLSHDHLDYHKTFKNYLQAKQKLFDELPKTAFALYNADDKNGIVMVQNTKAKVHSWSFQRPADFQIKLLENDINGLFLKFGETEFHSILNGAFNAANLAAVVGVASLLNISRETILRHASRLGPATGRFEKIPLPNGVTAIIDYAHTPDAIYKVLSAISEFKTPDQQLIAVVGCGGNRDAFKRPSMGNIAATLADRCVFTSDNPRFEDPDTIIDEMEKGVEIVHRKKCIRITERRQGISAALKMAEKGDIVLIAGKGHETYQDIKGIKHPFDDREVIEEFKRQIEE
ncbi:MAG: UDP-N-acetylmuramoyl-L-alanyl-D-glutamate--2,6-diaminopimelate ligase [Cryomorphaceae bacterium]|nr:UDP-N-acetylmuramoyl-L-alanyl-D-glutamate--2,6-diaminopimelate ligase [Cryomorphaceae bacterium]